ISFHHHLCRRRRHDSNHDYYLQSLLRDGKTQEAQVYLEHSLQERIEPLTIFDCGNYTFNVIMNHEIAIAQQKGVTVETDIVVPPKLSIADTHICSLLTNLMENAIEAAEHVDGAVITVKAWTEQDYLFLRVTNPVDEKTSAEERLSLETIKPDKELHGFGTKIVRQIAEEYQGAVKVSMPGNLFTVDMMLQI
ncbi:MAG: ATP-binding protein, partial [Lachnospiraceae bacterium]|nr:ATP-binding protein [Lachnospiraceae bacterium]